jgi:hypothetical protein
MTVPRKVTQVAVGMGLSTRVANSRECPRCRKLVGTWITFGNVNLARHKNPEGKWCRRPPADSASQT